jgi:hypothetical protein
VPRSPIALRPSTSSATGALAGVGARGTAWPFGGCRTGRRLADHRLRELGRRRLGDLRAVHLAAAPQHRHFVGVRHHLAELVRDHQHRALAALRDRAHVGEHLVGLLRRQHRGRLVEDQQARLQVELLQQLELLLLAGGEAGRGRVEIERERRRAQELPQRGALLLPVDQRRRAAAGEQQVLGDAHPGAR